MSEATYQAAFAKKAAESYEKNFVPAIGAPVAAAVTGIDEERRTALERDYAEACAPWLTQAVLKGTVRMTTLVALK